MKIYNYRTPNTGDDNPWKNCLFNDKAQLESFASK